MTGGAVIYQVGMKKNFYALLFFHWCFALVVLVAASAVGRVACSTLFTFFGDLPRHRFYPFSFFGPDRYLLRACLIK
ncbi:hypothetical protein B0T16DRAFT_131639 [Cercophora newfieldiana]|uniref:Uncharacterized protein n=1 Tax=Cercophora newfieldiana TaxID=92897 RepID=A0AA39YBX5_9PEZI|nr:hypothetical protein B0T16DRAFT_131639 [Cercophora newfieldiana]